VQSTALRLGARATGLFSVANRYLPFLRGNFIDGFYDSGKNSEPVLASTTYGDGLSGHYRVPRTNGGELVRNEELAHGVISPVP
jgi:hypothetical protein